MKALIVTGGSAPSRELLDQVIGGGVDLIIAADSGAGVLLNEGIPFDLALGDFDSLKPELLEGMKKDQEVITYKVNKDFTDTEAALHEAVTRGAKEVIILGGTGTRLDHLLANIGLLLQGLKMGVKVSLLDDHNEAFLTDGPCSLEPRTGWYLSFLPLGGKVSNFTLTGVKYPLKAHELTLGSTLTVSNEFTHEIARIDFQEGVVLVIISRD